jgi:hypothetical protein
VTTPVAQRLLSAAEPTEQVANLLRQFNDIRGQWDVPFESVSLDEVVELLDRWSALAIKRLVPLLTPREGERARQRLERPYSYEANGDLVFHWDWCRAHLIGLQFALAQDPDSVVVALAAESPEQLSDADLTTALDEMQDLMTKVATGGPLIQTVNSQYRQLSRLVDVELLRRGIANPNTFTDLWKWYDRWNGSDLPSWKSRRTFISDLLRPAQAQLRDHIAGVPLRDDAPTGWSRVDRCLDRIRKRLEEAQTEEDYQGVGLLCREALISLAVNVYDPERHGSVDATTPSDTDAKRMLEAYVAGEFPGGANEEIRRAARSSVVFADALQHRRTATFRDAALSFATTRAVVSVITILAGRRDP